MSQSIFSCVIPVKGSRPFFEEALASLKAQDFGSELEVIIQDADVEPDLGQSDALNKGFAKAHGQWLFWLNADDVLLPGALKKLAKCIESDDRVEWVAGNLIVIDEAGRIKRCHWDRGKKCDYDGRPVRVFGPSSFFKRGLLERAGNFDTALRYCMDTDMWCRFRDAGAWFSKVDAYIWGFREHTGSTTAGEKSAEEQNRQDLEVAAMHDRRGVVMGPADVRHAHLSRLLDGSYIKAWIDTWRFKGRKWQSVGEI